MAEGWRMWAISLLTIMLLTLLSAAPIDITDDIKKEDVKADNDAMHSHDENVTRGGKFFGHNQFEIGNINVPGSVVGDDVSIGHEVNIDVQGHTHDHHHHEDNTVIECKEGLREMFKSIDSNKDGLIDAMELLGVCHQNNIQITEPLAVRILTLPEKTVGFNIAKFCVLLKDCPSTNSEDSIYCLLQLFDKGQVLPGGFSDLDVNDIKATSAAAAAVSTLAGVTGDSNPISPCGKSIDLVGVEKAEIQVVAGTNYKLTLRLATHTGNDCTTRVEKVCEDISVWEKLPFMCPGDGPCHEVIQQENIKCKEALEDHKMSEAAGNTAKKSPTYKRGEYHCSYSRTTRGVTRPCNYASPKLNNVKSHVDSVHLCKRPHICPSCNSSFKLKAHLKSHHENAHGSRPEYCCGKVFASKMKLQEHERAAHKKFNPKKTFTSQKMVDDDSDDFK